MKPHIRCMYTGCREPAVRVVVEGKLAKCETHYQRDRAEPWGSVAREYGGKR